MQRLLSLIVFIDLLKYIQKLWQIKSMLMGKIYAEFNAIELNALKVKEIVDAKF